MTAVRFVIPGRPVPKRRPRVYSHGRRVQVYTPPETRAYEETVGLFARRACPEPLTGPVRLRVRVFLRDGRRCPDLSNLVKSIEDGCNGIAYADDSQVKAIEAWLLLDDDERAEIEVEPLGASG
jgi:Holliday junction resolvase RusA-like endonuclease